MSEIAAPTSGSDRVIRAGRSGKSPRAAASSVSSRRLGFHGCPRYRSGMEAVSKSGVAKRRLDRVGPGGARTRGHPCPGGDRAKLHAAVISCCVLPSAKATTCSPRVGEGRLPPAGFAGVVRPRCRAGAAAFVAVVAVLAETAFFACRPLLAGARPNHVGGVIARHKRAGRIELRDGSSTPHSRRRRSNAPRSAIPLAELTRKLDAVPEDPQVMLKLAILDVPDFYSALTNHTGQRRCRTDLAAGAHAKSVRRRGHFAERRSKERQRVGQLQRRDFPRARARVAHGARGLQLKGRRSTEWDPPPQVRFATTRRWRKPDSNRRSQATVSSGASGHAPPREARVG